MIQLINQYNDNFEAQELIRLIAYTNKSVFLTGKAGTGKSTLLKNITGQIKKKYVILASTGVAALQVGGQTIHSFFRIAPRPYLPNDKDLVALGAEKIELLNKIDLIIIDEVSMVRCDLLQAVDLSLRKNLKSSYPFAGKQLLLIGDLFQLPPVVNNKNKGEVEIVEHNYLTPFFFSAQCFEHEYDIQIIELQKVYRQKDESFINVLNAVRNNTVQDHHLITLNERYLPNYEPKDGAFEIILSTTNAIAENINETKLNSITGLLKSYRAIMTGEFLKESRNNGKLPTDVLLQLKPNAQVMFIKNDREKRWVNGSLGKIISMDDNRLDVLLDGETTSQKVERAEWESVEYHWNKVEGKIEKIVTGTFKQFPIKLAWAVTIHKSQGQTFENVVIDLGNGAFATGQTYVALSRCKTLEGIKLKKRVSRGDIKYDPRIGHYLDSKMNKYMEQERYEAIIQGLQYKLANIEPENDRLNSKIKEVDRLIIEAQKKQQSLINDLHKKENDLVHIQQENILIQKKITELASSRNGLRILIAILVIWIGALIYLLLTHSSFVL